MDGFDDDYNDSSAPSWRLSPTKFRLPPRDHRHPSSRFSCRHLLPAPRKERKIAEYYKKQESLLKGYNEMEAMTESGFSPGSLTEDEMKQLAKSERFAVHSSNIANFVLFIAKVYASVESRSLAVIASALDSFLDLLSVLFCGYYCICFSDGNSWLTNPVESVRDLISESRPETDQEKEKWMIGIMVSVTAVKFALMFYCRRFKNEIVRAYAQDHFFDVITNSVGLVAADLSIHYYWWIDPVGAIIIAIYTISTWVRTVIENVRALIGRTAPPEFIAKLTYLIWNHREEIKHIDTVRAYTIGSHYFVEVDIVLPEDMLLNQAHNIGETLQEKLEQLPEVERAFVHIDFEFTHKPEHKNKQPQRGGSTMDGQRLQAAAMKMVARPWSVALDLALPIMDLWCHRPNLVGSVFPRSPQP
ncbi:hypothetical protein BT93_C2359 [Corymbia citriodora subsp. variegata]|nr:hypothetical protein BT93_C2359 [Corymbia citriodora subsp. variegata]